MKRKIRKLTQVWMMIAMISASLWLIGAAEAGVWRDEFNGESLKGWTPMGQFIIWEIQDGFLHAKQIRPLPLKQWGSLEVLQLTAFPGPHQQLIITATNMKAKGNFGIALGKRFPEIPGAPFHYIFKIHRITARRFTGQGGVAPFHWWLTPRHPGTIWETLELKEMKLIFNKGLFQMFANGELRADFEDDHFDKIELISFVMIAQELGGAEGWVDSFTIYDPAFSVEPKGKLATMWGKMKGHH